MATSIQHEGPLLLLDERPDLVVELLGMTVPAGSRVCLGSADFTQAVPLERRADAVVTIEDGEQRVTTAIVVEIQLAADTDKHYSWPLYAASLHARVRCPTMLVVLAADAAVAAWARAPIATLQPASPFSPVVIGPEQIPRIESLLDAQRMPELAVLSALVHGDGPHGAAVLDSAIRAVAQLDEQRARTYNDLIYSSLGDVARAALETLMSLENYVYKSEFAKKYVAQGREEGREEARLEQSRRLVLTILTERHVGPSEAARARVAACAEPDTLERWVVRAASATEERDVFGDD